MGSGLLKFFYNHSVRLDVLEKLFEEKTQAITNIQIEQRLLNARVAVAEGVISELQQVLPDIRKIGALDTKLDLILRGLDQMVPRNEHEKVWAANDKRFEYLEYELRGKSDKS